MSKPVSAILALAVTTLLLDATTAQAQIYLDPCIVTAPLDLQPEEAECTMGWHATGWPEGSPGTYKPGYTTQLPDACYYDQSDYLQCFFSDAATACDGIVFMNDEIEGNGTTFDAVTLVEPIDATTARCHFANGQNTLVNYQSMPARGDKILVGFFGTYSLVAVSGPYRNQPMPTYQYGGQTLSQPKAGFTFTCAKLGSNPNIKNLRELILATNIAGNGGVLKSDLAGRAYPKPASATCHQSHPTNPGLCIEPTVLTLESGYKHSAQVHHEIPRKVTRDGGQSCRWGKNSMQNAAVISAQMNQVLSNDHPRSNDVLKLNSAAAYPVFVP